MFRFISFHIILFYLPTMMMIIIIMIISKNVKDDNRRSTKVEWDNEVDLLVNEVAVRLTTNLFTCIHLHQAATTEEVASIEIMNGKSNCGKIYCYTYWTHSNRRIWCVFGMMAHLLIPHNYIYPKHLNLIYVKLFGWHSMILSVEIQNEKFIKFLFNTVKYSHLSVSTVLYVFL